MNEEHDLRLDLGADEVDEISGDEQLSLMWCETHQKWEWHWMPLDNVELSPHPRPAPQAHLRHARTEYPAGTVRTVTPVPVRAAGHPP